VVPSPHRESPERLAASRKSAVAQGAGQPALVVRPDRPAPRVECRDTSPSKLVFSRRPSIEGTAFAGAPGWVRCLTAGFASSAAPGKRSRKGWRVIKRRISAIVLLAFTMSSFVAGCGNSDVQQAPVDGEVTKVEGPSKDDTEAFFKAMATFDAAGLSKAVKMTVPGSPARAYAEYQQQFMEAAVDAGSPDLVDSTGDEFSKVDGGWQVCSAGSDDCASWTNIVAEGPNILTFDVNNTPLGDLIVTGGSKPFKAGDFASVQLLTAYESQQSGNLIVLLRVKSKDAVMLDGYGATFRSTEGRQIKTTDAVAAFELAPNSSTTMALAFAGAKLGAGTVNLTVTEDGGNYESETVEIPTR
jgi:hypothetical protein